MYLNIFFCLFLATGLAAQTASPAGTWKTIDDESGDPKSHVELYQKNGKLYGKIVKLLQKPSDTVCEKCKGDQRNKPVLGMLIVENLEEEAGTWKGGNILDPESGNSYYCSIWLEGENLRVRGRHWTGLYRTQTWYRVK